jgi:hypothetical protein
LKDAAGNLEVVGALMDVTENTLLDAGPSALASASVPGRRPKPLTQVAGKRALPSDTYRHGPRPEQMLDVWPHVRFGRP